MSGISIYDVFETDTAAEENGKWFDDIMGNESGIDIKVRRMTSLPAAKNLQKHMTAARKFMVKGKLPPEIDKKILVDHLAEAVLLDWRGVNDRDGTPIPYSVEAAALIMNKLPNFRIAVQQAASNMDNFKGETQEEVAGN